jgi:hypothetical protein
MSDTWTVGQEVHRYRTQFSIMPARVTVTRVTKAFIYVGNERFWKHTGIRVGDTAAGLCARIEAIREETNSIPPA